MSDSLLLSWLILDLSTMLFIFLIFNLKLNYVNNLIHYYLVQVRARIGLFVRVLFSIVGRFNCECFFLFLKLGIFPFHFWYFRLLLKLDWWNIFILIRPNKVIVLRLIFRLYRFLVFVALAINLFFIVSSVLFEKQIKILLGLSSLFNMVWVFGTLNSIRFWLVYFLGYSLNLFLIIWVLVKFIKSNLGDYSQFSEFDLILFLGLLVFILLGVPPFLIFFIKVYILIQLLTLGVIYVFLVIRRIFFVYSYLIFFFLGITITKDRLLLFIDTNLRKSLILVLGINLFLRRGFVLIYYLDNVS